ncbi:hypothetical protein [Fumia xinanensis]|uniref:Uncharacterized protein n=1 Tax=Fumia xinanensis TaxID=2763659 RepID=A0A926E3M4_9FIRM|nr:hypothetical protein [Fumia xinanensis]MBC8560442.1 hypothetical protein [Fumia xinanensis]
MEPISFPITSKVIIYLSNSPREPVCGQIYSVYYNAFMDFCGVAQLLRAMESLYDTLDMPQASCENQAFHPLKRAKKNGDDRMIESRAGHRKSVEADQATFLVHVIYRQYNTWQGRITWMQDKTSRNFKSVFEMLKLMDDAMNGSSQIQYIWNAD